MASLDPVWWVHQVLSHDGEGQSANVLRILEAFSGQVDPATRPRCLRQGVFGEMKSGGAASNTEPRARDGVGDC